MVLAIRGWLRTGILPVIPESHREFGFAVVPGASERPCRRCSDRFTTCQTFGATVAESAPIAVNGTTTMREVKTTCKQYE
jgi:hypothetical protein